MNKPIISAIAAIGKNRELGKDGKIPWQLPEDLRHFKAKTTGHPVIMGRKTFESIGKPLSGRTNIVITRNPDYVADGVIVSRSVADAIAEAKKHDQEEIFVIGGGEIYKAALPYVDKLYLTVIEQDFTADTFFPNYSEEFCAITAKEDKQHNNLKYSFLEIVKP